MMTAMKFGSREDEVDKLPVSPEGQAPMPECTIYVHLCNGEIRAIPHAGKISIDRDLLCVCGSDCIPRATFPREDVYFCSRCEDAPAPPTD